jgi:membrane protein DedA with SNARE-associated domain
VPPTVGPLEEKPQSRRRLVLLVTPIVILTIAGTIASAFTPALASREPLLLIILDARNRNLVLARHVDFVPFLLVATIRRTLSDPLYFLLGFYYGDAAVRWLEEKAGWGPMVRITERFFKKASYPMVFMFPGAIVCALAGATGMSLGRFIVLNFAGTVTAVLVLRAFGDVLGGPVDDILGFFSQYVWQTTAVTIALVILSVVLGRLEGKSEVPSVDDLEAEIEREALLAREGERPAPDLEAEGERPAPDLEAEGERPAPDLEADD